jgi:hypothetical protein
MIRILNFYLYNLSQVIYALVIKVTNLYFSLSLKTYTTKDINEINFR